jgi:secondary thiamine-phosphate synthase enzyme
MMEGDVGDVDQASESVSDARDFQVEEAPRRSSVKSGLPAMMDKRSSRAGDARKRSSFVTGGEAATTAVPKWSQKTVTLPPQKRGCHIITPLLLKDIEVDLGQFSCGLAHFFLQHTSASLTINENYDSDVLEDVETFLNGTVPEGRRAPWKHTLEGPDDMPAHIKSSMFGCSVSVPITDGQLNLGTWQGIWICEHRDHASARKVVVTMTGT